MEMRRKKLFWFFVLALMLACTTVHAWNDPVSIAASSQYYNAGDLITGTVTSYKDTYNPNYYGDDGWLFSRASLPATVTYDFGSPIELWNLVLWNFSGDWMDATNRGAKDFSISFSNNGSSYTGNFSFVAAKAISSSVEPSQVFIFAPTTARYARITVSSNYGHTDWVGIGELRFNDSLVPMEGNPAFGATNVSRDTMLEWAPYDSNGITGYDVYFSTEPNSLDPNNIDLNLFKIVNNQLVATADPTPTAGELLEFNTTYYWKVDFYKGTILTTGKIWNFTTVPPAPIITQDPLDISVGIGQTAEFSVIGSNLEIYAWYKQGQTPPLANGGDVSGADTDTLSITNVDVSDEGYYYCVVSNTLSTETDQSGSAELLTKRLIAHWKFDGTLADETGVWAGAWAGDGVAQYVTGADGDPNGAIFFDGTAYVEISGSEDYFTFHPRGITVTLWVRNSVIGDTDDYMRIFSKANDYEINTHDNGVVYGGVLPLNVGIAGESTDWQLVAITFDPDAEGGSAAGVYGVYKDVDDQVVSVYGGLTQQAADDTLDQTVVRIGASSILNQGGLWYLKNAEVDDVRVYSYPLSREEIAQLQFDMVGGNVCLDMNAETLVADSNRDCIVDIEDFAVFAASWLNDELLN